MGEGAWVHWAPPVGLVPPLQRPNQLLPARTDSPRCPSDKLCAKLRMLESKLLHGEQSGGLDQLAREREEQLRRQEEELRQQREAEAEQARRIAELQAGAHFVAAKYNSLQEQAGATSQQLEEAWQEYQAQRQAATDIYEQYQRDREELVETIRYQGQAMLFLLLVLCYVHRAQRDATARMLDLLLCWGPMQSRAPKHAAHSCLMCRSLHHNLALKNLVIDAFIPQESVSKLLRRAQFDEHAGTWSLESPAATIPACSSPSPPRRPGSAAVLGRSAVVRLQLYELAIQQAA